MNKEAARELYKTLEPIVLTRETKLSDAHKPTSTEGVSQDPTITAKLVMRWFTSLGHYVVHEQVMQEDV